MCAHLPAPAQGWGEGGEGVQVAVGLRGERELQGLVTCCLSLASRAHNLSYLSRRSFSPLRAAAPGMRAIVYEKTFNLSGKVHNTNSSILLVTVMFCGKFHRQKVLELKVLSNNITPSSFRCSVAGRFGP